MADDLDGEWWLENNKNAGEDNAADSDGDEGAKKAPHDKESKGKMSEANAKKKKKKKRKNDDVPKDEVPPAKKAKAPIVVDKSGPTEVNVKKRKKKTKTEELAKKPVLAITPNDLICSLEFYYRDTLSPIEWDDIQLNADEHFSECNDMKHTPVSYMKSLLPKWTKLLKNHNKDAMKTDESIRVGSPLVLIITPSAIRATQLNRDLAPFKGENCKIAKLFAKHMKIKEQVKFLSKAVIHIGVGTPERIQALIENDSLSLKNTRKVVIDWTWRDAKLRRITEIPEIKSKLYELLKKHIVPRVKEGDCRFGLM